MLVDRYYDEQQMWDRRFGRFCALLANINRDPKKRSKPYSEEDFIPQVERKEQPVEEQIAILSRIGVRQ